MCQRVGAHSSGQLQFAGFCSIVPHCKQDMQRLPWQGVFQMEAVVPECSDGELQLSSAPVTGVVVSAPALATGELKRTAPPTARRSRLAGVPAK